MLDKFQIDVPKGYACKKLEKDGNAKKIYASRTDSSQQIDEKNTVCFWNK